MSRTLRPSGVTATSDALDIPGVSEQTPPVGASPSVHRPSEPTSPSPPLSLVHDAGVTAPVAASRAKTPTPLRPYVASPDPTT